MTDPVATAARAAATRLAAEHGPGLAADVEAALHGRDTARPGQYPVDLISAGNLIVAIATLAWMIYTRPRDKSPGPSPSTLARQVRIEWRRQHPTSPPDRFIETVSIEIIQVGHDQTPPSG